MIEWQKDVPFLKVKNSWRIRLNVASGFDVSNGTGFVSVRLGPVGWQVSPHNGGVFYCALKDATSVEKAIEDSLSDQAGDGTPNMPGYNNPEGLRCQKCWEHYQALVVCPQCAFVRCGTCNQSNFESGGQKTPGGLYRKRYCNEHKNKQIDDGNRYRIRR